MEGRKVKDEGEIEESGCHSGQAGRGLGIEREREGSLVEYVAISELIDDILAGLAPRSLCVTL